MFTRLSCTRMFLWEFNRVRGPSIANQRRAQWPLSRHQKPKYTTRLSPCSTLERQQVHASSQYLTVARSIHLTLLQHLLAVCGCLQICWPASSMLPSFQAGQPCMTRQGRYYRYWDGAARAVGSATSCVLQNASQWQCCPTVLLRSRAYPRVKCPYW